jgi:hypothetical protein
MTNLIGKRIGADKFFSFKRIRDFVPEFLRKHLLVKDVMPEFPRRKLSLNFLCRSFREENFR